MRLSHSYHHRWDNLLVWCAVPGIVDAVCQFEGRDLMDHVSPNRNHLWLRPDSWISGFKIWSSASRVSWSGYGVCRSLFELSRYRNLAFDFIAGPTYR